MNQISLYNGLGGYFLIEQSSPPYDIESLNFMHKKPFISWLKVTFNNFLYTNHVLHEIVVRNIGTYHDAYIRTLSSHPSCYT